MERIWKKIKATRDSGQKEYAHNNADIFANFKRVSNVLEVSKEKVLMTYLLKHIDGVSAYVKGHKSQREDVRGRLSDVIVYSMLLWAMIEESERGN
tara:strand:- start:100 stop:387 length:288 start_codon:yes stop_codon:yes gene_type:complete